MKLNFTLSNADFLAYQLYASSKSKMLIKNRRRARIIIPLIYVAFGLFLIFSEKNLGMVFLVFALLWYLIYPYYSKWLYTNRFKRHIQENHKNRVGQPIEIEFFEDHFISKDSVSESTTKISELEKLIDTAQHYFLTLNSGLSFIIPKKAISLEEEFKRMITNLNIDCVDETNWKWQ